MIKHNKNTVKIIFFILWFFVFALIHTEYAAGDTSVGGTIQTDTIWGPDGSPYIVTSDIIVKSCARLTIKTTRDDGTQSPVEIRFNTGKGMYIGTDTTPSSNTCGALVVQGTESCPITFTTNTPGQYWKGISFKWDPRNSAGFCNRALENKLSYCVIEYGGSVFDGANLLLYYTNIQQIDNCTIQHGRLHGIYMTSDVSASRYCNATINNSVITNNPEKGIYLYHPAGIGNNQGSTFPTINGCEISNNGTYGLYCENKWCNATFGAGNRFVSNQSYPLRIHPAMNIHSNNTFIDNGEQAIEVIAGGTIYRDTIWPNFNIPYIVYDNVTVAKQQTTDNPPTLTIRPGTTVKFTSEKGLVFGSSSNNNLQGILKAQGTKDQPITLTSIILGQYWNGITFWGKNSVGATQLNHLIVEYAGANNNAAIWFSDCYPNIDNITNSTIRYSQTNGIRFSNNSILTADKTIRNCNFYGNALYDINDHNQVSNINAKLNYWGTPNGPGQDYCSSAMVNTNVNYEPWLEEEFTDPFKFTAASATPPQFNPLTGSTTISFSLSQSAIWKVSIVNEQDETVWSRSGSGINGSVAWNGIGDNGGTASGVCFYRIEAENNSGTASPARGVLYLGQQAKACITAPDSGSLFTPGAKIIITGTAQPEAGQYYEVQYGSGENPASWVSISGPVYASRLNGELAVWDTAGVDQPVATVRLEVHTAGAVYTDIVRIGFFIPENQEPADNAVTYRYDTLGRLIAAQYPDSSAITYTYDRVGNRLAVSKTGQSPPTAVTISSFSARPTLKGVIIQWGTETENKTAGFNLYRKSVVQGEYQKINTTLIPAQGSATTGARYSYTDVPPRPGNRWQYLLEEVETGGATNRYGPVAAVNRALRAMSGTATFKKTLQTNCD